MEKAIWTEDVEDTVGTIFNEQIVQKVEQTEQAKNGVGVFARG